MKVQLLSDLHNEFYRPDAPPKIEQTGADLIVLAGDIDVGLDGLVWANKEAERLGKRILYVAGNHEFYHHDITLRNEMRAFAAGSGRLHFLENDELILGDVRFLGCTLWTDYRAAGDPVLSMMEVQQHLSDHHVVRNGERLFLPEDALAFHAESRAWLEGKLKDSFAGKTVVVTHHGPHLLCRHPSFPLNAIATAFLSDLNDLVEMADVWCFGHTHANLDAEVGKCRLVSNQRGYPMEGVKGFEPVFVFTV
jgi:predicted phosphodiesterase